MYHEDHAYRIQSRRRLEPGVNSPASAGVIESVWRRSKRQPWYKKILGYGFEGGTLNAPKHHYLPRMRGEAMARNEVPLDLWGAWCDEVESISFFRSSSKKMWATQTEAVIEQAWRFSDWLWVWLSERSILYSRQTNTFIIGEWGRIDYSRVSQFVTRAERSFLGTYLLSSKAFSMVKIYY